MFSAPPQKTGGWLLHSRHQLENGLPGTLTMGDGCSIEKESGATEKLLSYQKGP